MAHGLCVSDWVEASYKETVEASIPPMKSHRLGYLLVNVDTRRAEKMYQCALERFEKTVGSEAISTLDTVNNLGNLYMDLSRQEEAEQMLQRALDGKEKMLGREHISTLDIVKNLDILYRGIGRLEEAGQMHQRAQDGYAKAISQDSLMTYVPALDNM